MLRQSKAGLHKTKKAKQQHHKPKNTIKKATKVTPPQRSFTTMPSATTPFLKVNKSPFVNPTSQFHTMPLSKQSPTILTPKFLMNECNAIFHTLLPSKFPKRHFSTTTTPIQPPQAPLQPTVVSDLQTAPSEQPKEQPQQQQQQQAEPLDPLDQTQPIKITTSDEGETPKDENTAPPTSTTAATTTTTTTSNPQYSHFRRALPKSKKLFTPTESYFDENGDECLVIYEADSDTIATHLRERTRALVNLGFLGPVCAVTSYFTIPSPYSGIMMALASLFMLVNGGRVYSIHAFVTKVTAVWPQDKTDISSKMGNNLNEALIGLTPLPGEEVGNDALTFENEFTQRQKHNQRIAKERFKKYDEYKKNLAQEQGGEAIDGGENTTTATTEADTEQQQQQQQANTKKSNTKDQSTTNDDTTTTTTQRNEEEQQLTEEQQKERLERQEFEAEAKAAEAAEEERLRNAPRFPQPGVDPMGRVFSFNLNAPDPLTWKFGWSDMTKRASADDIKSGSFPLFDRASFPDQVRAWSNLPDPDFPEYVYIDRLNDGKTPLYQKVPLSDVAAVWSLPAVPPSLPQVTPKLIDQLQTRPHDQMVLMVRAQNTVTGLFPKFVKHDVAMNQLIFGANINSRNESKDKFESIRGRVKI